MKAELKVIREAFKKHSPNTWNIFAFDDKRTNGRRKVFKSYGAVQYKEVWMKVLKTIRGKGISGWELFEGSSWRGDGSVYGISKVVNDSKVKIIPLTK